MSSWMKRRLQAGIERGIAWYVKPAAERAAREAADAMYERVRAELDAMEVSGVQVLAVEVELLRAEVASLRAQLAGRADAAPAQRRRRAKPASGPAEAAR